MQPIHTVIIETNQGHCAHFVILKLIMCFFWNTSSLVFEFNSTLSALSVQSKYSCQKTFFITFLSKDVFVKFPSRDVILRNSTKKQRQKVVKKTENRRLKEVFWTAFLRLFVVSCPLGACSKCSFTIIPVYTYLVMDDRL